MTKFIKSFIADDAGAVSSEYAVLLVLIAAALVAAVGVLEGSISTAMNDVGACIGGTTASC